MNTCLDNALRDKHLPPLVPNDVVQSIKFHLDDEETPSYLILDGKLCQKKPFKKWVKNLQIIGDDGLLYAEEDKEVLLNRIENWDFPRLDLSFETELRSLGLKIAQLA